jgi:hypothetical protein
MDTEMITQIQGVWGQGADAVFGCTRQEQNGAENCIKKIVIIIPYHFLHERQNAEGQHGRGPQQTWKI